MLLAPDDDGGQERSMNPETTCDTMKHLRAREQQVLTLLLAGRPLIEICGAMRISRQTVWRMKSRSEFQQAFRAARSELLATTVDRLRHDALDFETTLHRIAMNRKSRGSDRVLACKHALDLMLKAVEQVDFEERLQRLEAIAGGRK